jgi:GNAT superfamily N-acetyltransferase
VRRFRLSDLRSVQRISRKLHPEWFTEDALENIPRDIRFARCYVAEEGKDVVGFLSVHSQNGKPMLGWMGIDPGRRGKGIGKRLLGFVESELIRFGYRDLRVETVGECSPVYEPYAETLRFYRAAGFKIEKRGRLRRDMGYAWRYSTLSKKFPANEPKI